MLGNGGATVRAWLGLPPDFGASSVGLTAGVFSGCRVYVDVTGTPTLVLGEGVLFIVDGATPDTATLAEIDLLAGMAAVAILPPPGAHDETWLVGVDPTAPGGPAWALGNPSSPANFVAVAAVTIPAGDTDITHWTIDDQRFYGRTGIGVDGRPAAPSSGIGDTGTLGAVTAAGLIDTPGLSFPVTAGNISGFALALYHFSFEVLFRSADVGSGLKLGLTYPTGGFLHFAARVEIPSVGGKVEGNISASGGSVEGLGVDAINTDYLATIRGVFQPGANGVVQVQHAAGGVGGGAVTVRQGTSGIVTRAG